MTRTSTLVLDVSALLDGEPNNDDDLECIDVADGGGGGGDDGDDAQERMRSMPQRDTRRVKRAAVGGRCIVMV